MERTYIMLKPDAVRRGLMGEIINKIERKGYKISAMKMFMMTKELLKELEEKPKVTYQYVIIKENEEVDKAKSAMSITMQCYKEYGKIEEDEETLRVLIEIIEGKPVAPTAKLAFLQTKINELIQKDNKKFLTNITDKYLQTKVLIKKAIAAGIIVNRGNYLYLRDGNTPLCEQNEEPTLVFAAKFINHPKHQDIKFSIEAKLNQ